MKKSVILCMVAVVLISVFVGCSVKNSDVNENAETSSFSASKETTLPISTAENDTKADTTTTATTANAKRTNSTSNKIKLNETTTKKRLCLQHQNLFKQQNLQHSIQKKQRLHQNNQ